MTPSTLNHRTKASKHLSPRPYTSQSWAEGHLGDSTLGGIWVLPKIRGPLLGGPYNKVPNSLGSILGSPTEGNYHIKSP